MAEPTPAQMDALREAVALLKAHCCDGEIGFMDELKRIADSGDVHAAYLHEVISELDDLEIEVPGRRLDG